MFCLKMYKRVRSKKFKRDNNVIKSFYERKKILCDKCQLCKMSVDEINDNYDEILEKIKRPE